MEFKAALGFIVGVLAVLLVAALAGVFFTHVVQVAINGLP